MRIPVRSFQVGLLGVAVIVGVPSVRGASYEDRPVAQRGAYTAAAIAVNVIPVASALVEPKCLPGYILCKASFAGMSLLGATGQLVLSGGSDLAQTRAILYRGFAGDWFLTGRHVAGDVEPRPIPDPPARP